MHSYYLEPIIMLYFDRTLMVFLLLQNSVGNKLREMSSIC